MSNTVYIATAGSGKTTLLVDKACAVSSNECVLLLTYTESNAEEIHKKFYQRKGYIPRNVTILTWYSFLLCHLIKPYQNYVIDDSYEINGILLDSQVNSKRKEMRIPKFKWWLYYFTKERRVLSDWIRELAFECNEQSGGKAIERLTNLYEHIYIDEVQDLAGYDLELIKAFFLSKSNIILAGDPRQTTYLTNHSAKNKKYSNGKILAYLQNERVLRWKYEVDNTTLGGSWRCGQKICDYASIIASKYPPTVMRREAMGEDDGVYLVRSKDKVRFLSSMQDTMQLRWWVKTKNIDPNYRVMNFGDAKGLTFNAVLIYPTDKMAKWMKGEVATLGDEATNKFYVAVTRARYLVGIVWDEDNIHTNLEFWNNN